MTNLKNEIIEKEEDEWLFSRQTLMFSSEDYNIPIKIYWVGFIWSNLANTFAKTWFKNIFLIDPDKVNWHNLLNQLYKEENLWKSKVQALKENIENDLKKLTWVNIFPLEMKLEESFEKWFNINSKEIIVLCTDNKESRINFAKEILKNWDKNNWYKDTFFLFINTSWDVIYLWVNKGDKEFFSTMVKQLELLKPEDISVWLCGEKSSFYLWNLVSWYMISEVRKLLNRKDIKDYTKESLFWIKSNMFNYNFKWFSTKIK